jgi:hypothetical protein
MGLRGPGAGRLKAAREAADVKPLKRTWEAKGLSRAERVIRFIESLPITKGKLVGQTMKLLPKQRDFVADLFGLKRVRIGIKSEPRGNGKTGLLAPLALAFMLGPEAEPRGEIYAAAIDRQQAGIMFNEIEAIILAVPEFAVGEYPALPQADRGSRNQGAGSVFEALSSDARRGHGLAPTLWVYDEFAQAKDRELLDNLITAMGKRRTRLGVIISTQAPNDEHPLSQLIDDGLSAKQTPRSWSTSRCARRRRPLRCRDASGLQPGARHLPRRGRPACRGRAGPAAAGVRAGLSQPAAQPARRRRQEARLCNADGLETWSRAGGRRAP